MITPNQFRLFDENAQWETLRNEEINRRKKVMERINEVRSNESGEQLYSVLPFKSSTPIASFTYRKYANILSSFLSPAARVEHEAYPKSMPNDIDKYADYIAAGKRPFFISLLANGDVFEIEKDIRGLFDPGIAQNTFIDEDGKEVTERAGIGGTFWGYDQHDALVEAENFRLQMIDEGKLFETDGAGV